MDVMARIGGDLDLAMVLAAIVIAVVGLGAGYLLFRWLSHRRGEHAAKRAEELLSEARQRAGNVLKEAELKAKEEIFKRRE